VGIEILEQLEVLTDPALDLATLSLDGVRFGSSVADFPRDRIAVLTFARIVHSYSSGTGVEPEYRDVDGHLLTRDEVIDSVFADDGMAHFKSKISFKVASGKIVGFAISGEQLQYFSEIQNYDQCLRKFGKPNRAERRESCGELMGYDNYYYESRKMVSWDSWDNRISMINLGSYDGNDGHPEIADR